MLQTITVKPDSAKYSYLMFCNNQDNKTDKIPIYMYNQEWTNSNPQLGKDFYNNRKRLEEFLKLEYNWNDNNAEPFEQSLIDKCIKILKQLNYQPEIFPTARNSIQFEYEKVDGHYLEIEIFQEKHLFLLKTPDNKYIEGELKNNKEIIDKIDGFYA